MKIIDKIDTYLNEGFTMPGDHTVWYYNGAGKLDNTVVRLGKGVTAKNVLDYCRKNWGSKMKLVRVIDDKGKIAWENKKNEAVDEAKNPGTRAEYQELKRQHKEAIEGMKRTKAAGDKEGNSRYLDKALELKAKMRKYNYPWS